MIDKSKFEMVFNNEGFPEINMKTIGVWYEGQKVKVVYSINGKQTKEVERRVNNNKDDLYIMIENMRYPYSMFVSK